MVSLREMARADAERVPPTWLRLLLGVTFFESCPQHPDASRATRSGGCNTFCTDCAERPLCQACILEEHDDHKTIQVRKSSKHSVVKMRDLEEVLNVEDVQPYNINGDMVLFLTERPQMGKGKAGKYRCDHCDRALLHQAYRFCSLGCKLECMDGDFSVSFAVQPKSETQSSEEDETETEDDDALCRPTRLRNTAARSERANRAEEDGATAASTSTTKAAVRVTGHLASSDAPSTASH